MIKPTVNTAVGGAHCVVSFTPQHYIQSLKDVRYPDKAFIEVVNQGRAYFHTTVKLSDAPGVICRMMRKFAQFGTCTLEGAVDEQTT